MSNVFTVIGVIGIVVVVLSLVQVIRMAWRIFRGDEEVQMEPGSPLGRQWDRLEDDVRRERVRAAEESRSRSARP